MSGKGRPRQRWLTAGVLIAVALAGCGSSSKNAQNCWNTTLDKWVIAQTPGGYLDELHAFPRSLYAKQVGLDAAYYEAGRQFPGGTNGLELTEFAKVQRKCGKLKITSRS